MANSYAVQHHFGSKAGLVQAVYDYRIPALEDGARRLLQEAQEKAGEITFRALLTARFLPLVDSLGVKAQRSFSLFLLRLLDRKNDMHPFSLSTVPQPVAHDINRRMESCFPDLPVQVFDSRFRLASDLFIGAIVEKHRLDTVSQDLYLNSQRYWEEVLDIMEAVFAVPYKGLL
jgi:AcrR family transcriptional regulator